MYADGTLSDSQTFGSQEAAAKHVLSNIADLGETLNVEFAGDIVGAGIDKSGNQLFGYTRPVVVGENGGTYDPSGNALSSYHNHNGGRSHSPKFSPDDTVWVKNNKINMFMMNKTHKQFRVCEVNSYRCSGPGGYTRKGTVLEF